MEHPLITNIGDLDENQLMEKITELNGKLTVAMKSGNANLINQVQMALESYRNKLAEKTAEAKRNKEDKFGDRIDIS